jgi:hypothetical protein
LIAFSTSGEHASDIGTGENGLYTECLLRHITDKNIPIEEFFKRVRTSVYEMSGGKQTAWEHTSLIGNFFFNSGQLIHSANLPYSSDVVSDGEYQPDGSAFGNMIAKLKRYTWDIQNDGIDDFKRIRTADLSPSQLFLFGRNLLQAACGNAYAATNIFDRLGTWLDSHSHTNENHILNGILFEIYFDSKGQFRQEQFKSAFMEQIVSLRSNNQYHKAFTFIVEQLSNFIDYIFYMPSIPERSLPVELGIVKQENPNPWDPGSYHTIYTLISVKLEGTELLTHKVVSWYDGIQENWIKFLDSLSRRLCVPVSLLRVSPNIDLAEITTLTYPYPLVLSKRPMSSN